MSYKVDNVVPYGNAKAKKSLQIEQMFNDIAPNYDKMNKTLSLGIDKSWRKRGIMTLKPLNPKTILDIATGTGDLALLAYQLLSPEKIVGIDISDNMMEIGRQKVAEAKLSEYIEFSNQNCDNLSFLDNSFDAAMVAFGIRNFENLDKSLQEICRVLKPNGQLMVLELSVPEYFPMRQGYKLYSSLIPVLGKLISKNREAYNYLPKSIRAFAQNRELIEIIKKNGFCDATFKKLSGGVCSVYLAKKSGKIFLN